MSLSKRLRFEVFKRDRFTCQYCGRSAPETILEVDHIEPKAEGGGDDILNLLTSCFDCNRGKGPHKLADQAVLARQLDQLGQLHERREQLEMMIEWRRSLDNIEETETEQLTRYWCELTGWKGLTDLGRSELTKLHRKHGVKATLDAMKIAFDGYARYCKDGSVDPDSLEVAFNKISGVLHMQKIDQEKPYMRDLFYVRGILRKRLSRVPWGCIKDMEEAVLLGVDVEALKELARSCDYETQWTSGLASLMGDVDTSDAA